MNEQTIKTVEDCTAASDSSRMSFPAVVAALAGAGIERYHTDLIRWEKTYFTPDGASHTAAGEQLAEEAPAELFSTDGIVAAIRSIQAGAIDYREFCGQIVEAGCVAYFVSITGRRAVYYGRSGDLHVEWFPSATQ